MVTADELVNPAASIDRLQIGDGRPADDIPAATNIGVVAPSMGTVKVCEVDDLGTNTGSAIWLSDADSIDKLRARNAAVPSLNWRYKPGRETPWGEALEPIRVVLPTAYE